MKPEQNTQPQNAPPPRAWLTVGWSAVLLLCIGVLIWLVMRPLPEPPELPTPPSVSTVLPQARFFDEEVRPAITRADEANREAASRCIERLEGVFASHRGEVPAFVEDLTSWGTRIGIMRRMPADWWNSQNGLQEYIGGKFESHLFTEESLRRDIEAALATYRGDLDANSAALLTEVSAAITTSDLTGIAEVDYGEFSADLTLALQTYSVESARRSVSQLVITEIASGLGGAAASYLVVAASAQLTALVASSTVASGGVAASGAVAGGGGGTLAGPVGAAAGAVTGLAIGIVIDWWMTGRLQADLTEQLNSMIDTVETSVIAGTDQQGGLRPALDESCAAMQDAYMETFYRRLVPEAL